MSTANRVPAVNGLFTETADGARLVGSRCATCSTPYFPSSDLCHHPDCTESKMEETLFGPKGTLWSLAIQNYPPPLPTRFDEPYKPYAMGVVDLTEGLRVIGRILCDDPDNVEVGNNVELVIEPIATEENGDKLITWQFKLV